MARKHKCFPSLYVIFALSACQTIRAPVPSETNAPPLAVQASHIAVPVTVSTLLPQSAINAAVPQRLDADDYTVKINGGADKCHDNGASVGYHVHRDPIIISGAGNTLSAKTAVAYNVIGRAKPPLPFGACGPLFSGSCGRGEPEPRLKVGLSVTLGGINPDWTPNITFTPASVSPDGACKVAFFDYHIEDKIADLARNAINSSSAAAQSGVANAIDLPNKVSKAWKQLQTPIKLAPSVWLAIHPQQIGAQPFVVTPNTTTSGLFLQAMPTVSFSDAAPPTDNNPLPPPSAALPSNQYYISLPMQADYATLSKQIQAALKLQTAGIRYPPTGSNYLTVTGADVYGYGQKAVVRLELRVRGIFGARAVLYLLGTPAFDTNRNVISFPDLDFSVDSKNILLNLVAWLEQDKLRDDLRARATYDITEYVNKAKQTMVSELNQDVGIASLKGTVDAINLLGVYISPDQRQFTAQLQTSGTLNVEIK